MELAQAQRWRLALLILPGGIEGGIGNKINSPAAEQMEERPMSEGSITIGRGDKELIPLGAVLQ